MSPKLMQLGYFALTMVLVTPRPMSASEYPSAVPTLETEGTQYVTIRHPGLQAVWRIQFPEAVGDREAFYFWQRPVPVHWQRNRDGGIEASWQASEQWTKQVDEHPDEFQNWPLAKDIELSLAMTPSVDRVDLSIGLTNRTDRTLTELYSDGGCLQHHSDAFIDTDGSRTFIKTENGILPMSRTHRTIRIRGRYPFEPEWYKTRIFKDWEYFWGRSKTRPVSPFVAARNVSGTAAIGIGFDHSMEVMQNSDDHHCMHSDPYFGTLEAGETKVLRGVILFGRDVGELFERFEHTGYRPDATPPIAPVETDG